MTLPAPILGLRAAGLAALAEANDQERLYWERLRAGPRCAGRCPSSEQIVGNVFTIYRCPRCGAEEWL